MRHINGKTRRNLNCYDFNWDFNLFGVFYLIGAVFIHTTQLYSNKHFVCVIKRSMSKIKCEHFNCRNVFNGYISIAPKYNKKITIWNESSAVNCYFNSNSISISIRRARSFEMNRWSIFTLVAHFNDTAKFDFISLLFISFSFWLFRALEISIFVIAGIFHFSSFRNFDNVLQSQTPRMPLEW